MKQNKMILFWCGNLDAKICTFLWKSYEIPEFLSNPALLICKTILMKHD